MVGYAQVYPIPYGRKADVFGDMWKGLWGTLDNQFQALHSHSQVLVWLSFRLTCIKVPRRELVHVHRSGLSRCSECCAQAGNPQVPLFGFSPSTRVCLSWVLLSLSTWRLCMPILVLSGSLWEHGLCRAGSDPQLALHPVAESALQMPVRNHRPFPYQRFAVVTDP